MVIGSEKMKKYSIVIFIFLSVSLIFNVIFFVQLSTERKSHMAELTSINDKNAGLDRELTELKNKESYEEEEQIEKVDEVAEIHVLTSDVEYVFGKDLPKGTYDLEVKYTAEDYFFISTSNSTQTCRGATAGIEGTEYYGKKRMFFGDGATILISGNAEIQKLLLISSDVPESEAKSCEY